MSSPADFYRSLPPVTKAYGTLCFLTTVAYQLKLLNPMYLYFDHERVFKQFQIWRVVTSIFFLGPFSMKFGIRLLMIARYGVQLERSVFSQRTADFVWMIILSTLTLESLAIFFSFMRFYFLGSTIIFIFLCLWSREFPNTTVSLAGLVNIQGFYLPWAMLFLNTIFGSKFMPDFAGIVVGHIYYFLTVLYPRTGGKDYLRAPRFMHKLVNRAWGIPSPSSPSPVGGAAAAVTPPPSSEPNTFTGRSYRLDRD